MLKATDTPFAPWTLVDFNDQRLGRLTMIRDLLDRIPDHEVPNQVQQLPPLGHAPRRESFSAGLQPLPHYPVQASPEDERED
jgi:hypothetical protein